ncbi:ATP-binding protein [Bacillus salitolerans]|uniref:histidine kinase n=1 Tax=Bacillus salitolerans TaxID=1437434 RepID=A0ABW4LYW4_9BACI
MNFKTILFTGFGLVIAVMGIVMIIIINTLSSQTENMHNLVNDRYNKIEKANQIRYEIGTINIEYLENDDIQSVELIYQNINQYIRELDLLLELDQAQTLLTNLEDQYFTFRSRLENLLDNLGSGNNNVHTTLIQATSEEQAQLIFAVEELINFQEGVMRETIEDARISYNNVIRNIIVAMVIGILVALIMGYFVTRNITGRLIKVKNVMKTLTDDNYGYLKVDVISNDEIGEIAKAYNELATTLERQEKIEQEYRVKIEDQNWIKTKIAELSVLTQGVNDLHVAGDRYIRETANSIGASFGVLYLLQNDGENEYLDRTATYAYANQSDSAFAEEKIWLGAGLVGQCAKSKEVILLNSATDEYINITSSFGQIKANNIIILPILVDNEPIGVIELATLTEISSIEREFLLQSTEMIGIIFNRIFRHKQVEELLKESQTLNEELQTQSEELQLQQEELRTMNDELEAQYKSSEMKTKELEEIKENLEQKTKEIVMSSKYKSEFMANMSHELRTPLNSLLILAQMLLENKDQNLNSKQLEYVTTIYSSGTDLLQLINDILDLSKIESGKMEIVEGEIYVDDLFTSLERQFGPIARKKGLIFTYETEDHVPSIIYTDEQRLNQILKNLLSNAVKFTEEGKVHLSLSQKHQDGLDFITFSVIDTGIGIPTSKKLDIFEAFRQADGTTSRKYGGTGLGLSISKELATLLNGDLTVESTEGKGSTFTLYIPLHEMTKQEIVNQDQVAYDSIDSQDHEIAATNDHPGSFNGKKVLVVDDDMRNIFALTSSLEAAGMDVTFSENGKEALAKLQEQNDFDIVLMDIMMPEMDGYEAMKSIRSMEQFADLPIIALTAKAMKDDRQKCIDAGATDYISKPVNLEQLFSIIRVWLSHK